MYDGAPNWTGTELGGGRYRVTGELGAGGMGFVYLARDQRLDCPIVVKVPRPGLLANARAAERFQREIRHLVRLAHPHIVKILDVGEHEGLPFVVLQHLPGGSLRDRQQATPSGQRLALPLEGLTGWLEEVAAALDFIHRLGHVHRDIKPDNILFDAHGNAYAPAFDPVRGTIRRQASG
jgi:serine/threonine-protein kinase